MSDMITQCERVAHDEGLAAGLAAALDTVDVNSAPGGVAAVPATWVTAGAPVVPYDMARDEGVAFVRCETPTTTATDELTRLGVRLGAVRLALTRRLTEHAVEHLSSRVAAGEPTIRKQLVLGTLADVLTATEALRQQLRVSPDSAVAVADVHDRITELDWELAKLLGASGYVTDSPKRGAHVSELIANCWIVREGA
ncbi:MAG TPA: acyl-CoA dehydrogenase family protein [Micromonosporaceae bacterium]